MMKQPIQVWRWEDAPKKLRELSDHGGDEDWLALIPSDYVNDYVPWLESGSPFGVCSVSEHKLPDGTVVKIGAHA